ncbi:hypothetical protein KGQ19_20785 [Catenulispora sp. NL8]|uniref:Transmembrane transport protein n=1 Tax=Catenulispora pinistramenti TaxID=2705254 RepID=A0ABS5KTG1_9ACTN|nr:hypothetical protein [Catenulispora pinistramenti]MBS2549304.1 hypothetical protein [Catenulispora pinistramenti]
MIWLTYRQFRMSAIVAAGVVIAFGIAVVSTSAGLSGLYARSGLASCHASCTTSTTDFLTAMKADGTYPALYFVGLGLLLLAPAVIGAFWGAPMITREVEGRTLRFVWHQSVTPTRWARVKISLLGLASMAFAGLISLLISWWAAPIDAAGGFPVGGGSQLSRFQKVVFDARGVAPLGYAALGFVVGVVLGVLIRRTVPAMAATLVVVAAIQLAVPTWIRPDLVTPVARTGPVLTASAFQPAQFGTEGQVTVPVDIPGAWIVTDRTVKPDGHSFSMLGASQCSDLAMAQTDDCLAQQDLRQVVRYQPANRFWEFQGIETAMLLGASMVLAAGGVLWLRKVRLT